MTDFSKHSTAELLDLRAKGRRRLQALQMGNLADMRVSAHYEPFPSDSDYVLDRNFQQINRLCQAIKSVSDEIDARAAKATGSDQ